MAAETLLLPPQLPHEAVQAEVEALGILPEYVTPGTPVTIGEDQPDLMEDSPYGVGTRVRGVIGAGNEAFDVVDIRGVAQMQEAGGARRMIRYVHGQKVADQFVSHLLISKTFGDPENSLPGYKGLRPGVVVSFGRNNPQMEQRFGKVPTVSYDHGEVSVDDVGNVTVSDTGSTNGTRVIAKKKPIVEATTPEPQIQGDIDPLSDMAARPAHEHRAERRGGVAGRVGRAIFGQRPGVIRADIYGNKTRVQR